MIALGRWGAQILDSSYCDDFLPLDNISIVS